MLQGVEGSSSKLEAKAVSKIIKRDKMPITATFWLIFGVAKFDEMCLHNKCLHQNKELQQQLLSWAAELLEEARKDWSDIHATTFEAIVAEDRK